MFYVMVGQSWERDPNATLFETITEAEDEALRLSKENGESAYIFEEGEGYVKEIHATK